MSLISQNNDVKRIRLYSRRIIFIILDSGNFVELIRTFRRSLSLKYKEMKLSRVFQFICLKNSCNMRANHRDTPFAVFAFNFNRQQRCVLFSVLKGNTIIRWKLTENALRVKSIFRMIRKVFAIFKILHTRGNDDDIKQP